MDSFYKEVVDDLLRRRILDQHMRVLVLCGGEPDKEVLVGSGFSSVVISNLDTRMKGTEYAPFEWSYQDAEHLSFEDDSFDFSMVHEGLHHCYSPHRALLEMYRVAKKGILLFEPYDNLLTQLGVLLKFGQEYEDAAVFYNDCVYGGVKNSSIPNYVYRWTEKEIVKTIHSFAPCGKHSFQFIHKMCVPWTQLKGRKNKLFFLMVLLSLPILKAIGIAFPKKSSNNFAALVLKPELPRDLHPWLSWRENEIKPNLLWLSNRYKK